MNYIKKLQKLGLKENEAEVYLAGLKLGPTTILSISKETGIKRTNVYALVDNLMKKGLFNLKTTSFKKYYSAESPEKLKTLIDHRLDQTVNLLKSKVEKKNNTKNNEILHFKGVGGMKNAFSLLLEDLQKDDFYYVISDGTRWYNTDQTFLEKFLRKRTKMKLDQKLILINNEFGQRALKNQEIYDQKVKLLPDNSELKATLVFTPYRVLTHQLTGERLTTIIESSEAAIAQKQLFDIAWENLK